MAEAPFHPEVAKPNYAPVPDEPSCLSLRLCPWYGLWLRS